MFDFIFRNKEKETLPLPYSTEIHAHVIPGVDDGSQKMETSLELITSLCEFGVKKLIATPHRTDETFENTPDIIEPIYQNLKAELRKNNIPIDLHYSFEYRMDEGFIALKDANKLRPLDSKHILVENSFIQPLWNLDELIFELKLKGFIPILAHPERYSYYHMNKKEYTHLHESECNFQVNILSFAGCYGKTVQEVCYWLLEKGYVDYMGSDLHHMEHIKAIRHFLQSKHYKKLRSMLNIKNDAI